MYSYYDTKSNECTPKNLTKEGYYLFIIRKKNTI